MYITMWTIANMFEVLMWLYIFGYVIIIWIIFLIGRKIFHDLEEGNGMDSVRWLILKESRLGVSMFLRNKKNRIPNSIWRNVNNLEGNVFILIIFIYVLYILEHESLWWRTQIYDSHILYVEREKLDLLSPEKNQWNWLN